MASEHSHRKIPRPASRPLETLTKIAAQNLDGFLFGLTCGRRRLYFSIIQCRAFANGVCEYAEQIAGIINANKEMIAERTESRRVSA